MNGCRASVSGLVLFLFVREVVVFDVVDILPDGIRDLFMEMKVATQKTGLEFRIDTQQVMHHQYLSVAVFAGADTDDRDLQALRHGSGQLRRYLFQDHAGTTGFFEQPRVVPELFGFRFLPGPHAIGPKLINGLRGQTEMADDGYACPQYPLDRFQDLFPAFAFDAMGAGFLHDPDSRGQGLFGIGLVGPEWQIDHDEGPVDPPNDRRGVVDHLVEGDGKGGLMSRHDIGSGVADQDDVDACAVEDPGEGVIVGSDHRDLFPVGLHAQQGMGRYLFYFRLEGHGENLPKR